MASKALRPCHEIGCHALTRSTYCEKHTKSQEEVRAGHQQYNKYKRDQEAAGFYKSKAWRQLRAAVFARDNGLCQQCRRDGRTRQGKIVHHIKEYKDRKDLALEEQNLEVLCMSCHNRIHGK